MWVGRRLTDPQAVVAAIARGAQILSPPWRQPVFGGRLFFCCADVAHKKKEGRKKGSAGWLALDGTTFFYLSFLSMSCASRPTRIKKKQGKTDNDNNTIWQGKEKEGR